MAKKYSNKQLEFLSSETMPFLKKSKYYRVLLKKSIEHKGWDYSKLDADDQCYDIVHIDLCYDLCEIVNDLAILVLNEKEKSKNIVKILKDTVNDAVKNINHLG